VKDIQLLELTQLGLIIMVMFLLGLVGLICKRWSVLFTIAFFGTGLTLTLMVVGTLVEDRGIVIILYLTELILVSLIAMEAQDQ